MEIQPKVVVGILTGMALGGWLAGKACARTYTLLNPEHAALFGLASTITAYVIHKGIQWLYRDEYQMIPGPLKVVMNLSAATLLTGALASDCFGVNFMISAALKIITGSVIMGSFGWFIGKNLTAETPSIVSK